MENKITVENKITTPFTWVENDLIRSKSLSFQALGLYLVLRSFGKDSYPSIPYLCSIGKTTRDKMYKILDELIEAKLLLRKRTRNKKGYLSKTVYRILSINDNYGIVYKEFTGKEYVNFTASHPRPEIAYMDESLENSSSHPRPEIAYMDESLENSSSHPRPEYPDMDRAYQAETRKSLKIEDLKAQKIRLIRTKEQEESFKTKTHTYLKTGVCEFEKIKNIRIFKNIEHNYKQLIARLVKLYSGIEVLTAAEYLNHIEETGEIKIKKPLPLLISTLKTGIYTDIKIKEKINKNQDFKINELNKKVKETIKDEVLEQQVNDYIRSLPKLEYIKNIEEIKNKYFKDATGELKDIMSKLKYKTILRDKFC